jgi:hypothetical protein
MWVMASDESLYRDTSYCGQTDIDIGRAMAKDMMQRVFGVVNDVTANGLLACAWAYAYLSST